MMPPAVVLVQEAAPTEDIVVLGRRLRSVRLSYKVRDWKLRSCRIKVSSGDAVTDAVVCETVATCVSERKASAADLSACLGTRKPEMVAVIAARKKAQHAQD